MELTPPCPVCGGRSAESFATARGAGPHLHTEQARCTSCGLVAALPQATGSAMAAYYGGAYYETRWTDADGIFARNRAGYAATLWPLFVNGWRTFEPPANGRVFEVGCGYGSLLAVFRDHGFAVRGVESSARAAKFCQSQGLDVQVGLTGKESDRAQYDVALAAYVLEHVGDPAAFMRELTALSRPGGAVVIVTDAIWTTQYALERARAAVRGLAAPYRSSTDHTYVFAPHHLQALFEQAGCDQVRVRAFTDPPPRESLHWRAYKGACRTTDRLLGLGEYLVAVGRRRA